MVSNFLLIAHAEHLAPYEAISHHDLLVVRRNGVKFQSSEKTDEMTVNLRFSIRLPLLLFRATRPG